MIRYGLKCDSDHGFESWFQSAAAFDTLKASGHLTCPECGSTKVDKSLMAPRVRPARKAAAAPAPEVPSSETAAPNLSAPTNDRARAIAELRKKVEAESDYVGLEFASEARAMHDGDVPHRAIYGEAKLEDAKKLVEDGVPVAPLPFRPKARTN